VDLVITDIAMPKRNGLELILDLTREFLNEGHRHVRRSGRRRELECGKAPWRSADASKTL
jgi:hypothetical protein